MYPFIFFSKFDSLIRFYLLHSVYNAILNQYLRKRLIKLTKFTHKVDRQTISQLKLLLRIADSLSVCDS